VKKSCNGCVTIIHTWFRHENEYRKKISVWVIGLLFTLAGINHFVQPDVYTKIMPPHLPAQLMLVYVSGVFEILGGVGIMVPRLRRSAGCGLIALLLAVSPAHVHMVVTNG